MAYTAWHTWHVVRPRCMATCCEYEACVKSRPHVGQRILSAESVAAVGGAGRGEKRQTSKPGAARRRGRRTCRQRADRQTDTDRSAGDRTVPARLSLVRPGPLGAACRHRQSTRPLRWETGQGEGETGLQTSQPTPELRGEPTLH